MATAGIAQGIGVALIHRSLPLLVYSLAGALAWQFLARPKEERLLARWFGAPYEHYRRSVPCRRPRGTRYRPPAGGTSSPRAP